MILTVPGTMRTAAVGKTWSKILGKTNVKKLVNRFGCFKNCVVFNRKPM